MKGSTDQSWRCSLCKNQPINKQHELEDTLDFRVRKDLSTYVTPQLTLTI